jgi:hypothetical protein
MAIAALVISIVAALAAGASALYIRLHVRLVLRLVERRIGRDPRCSIPPGLFDRMVLFGAVARRAGAEQIALATAARVEAIRKRGWRSILDDMEAAEKFPVPRWFIKRVEATAVAPWLAFTEARPSWNWSIWDAAPVVETPALLIAGELEDPDDVVGELAAQMPPRNPRARRRPRAYQRVPRQRIRGAAGDRLPRRLTFDCPCAPAIGGAVSSNVSRGPSGAAPWWATVLRYRWSLLTA